MARIKGASSHHEVEVEPLSEVSEVPETLRHGCSQNHGEVVLVGAPEQLLVRSVGVGVRGGSTMNHTPKHKDWEEAGNPEEHVWTSGDVSSK